MKNNFDITLDLHGCRAECALKKLNDILYASGTSGKSLLVVHGCGGGTLRNIVRQAASECVLVRDIWAGEEHNLVGFAGVTAIFL